MIMARTFIYFLSFLSLIVEFIVLIIIGFSTVFHQKFKISSEIKKLIIYLCLSNIFTVGTLLFILIKGGLL